MTVGQRNKLNWKSGAVLIASAMIGALSCGDYATMPSPNEGGGASGQNPRLIARDSLRVTQGHPGANVERCADLANANYIARGVEAYLCIPVEFHSAGIEEIVVTATQTQTDPVSGVPVTGDAFEKISIPGLKDSPLRDRHIYVVKLSPAQKQVASEAKVSVTLTSTNKSSATFSTAVDIRAIPNAAIVEPQEGAVFHPGDPVEIRVEAAGAGGVEKVELEWSGLVTGSQVLSLGSSVSIDTVWHTVLLPSHLEPGEIELRARAVDPKGVKGDWAVRLIQVQLVPRDTTAPVPSFDIQPDSILERGSVIAVVAKDDDSGVAKLGYALLPRGTEDVVWSDSTLVYPYEATSSYDFVIDLPSGFAFGDYELVIYAEDAAGNRGYFGGTSSVQTLKNAKRTPVAAVQGVTIRHLHGAWLKDVAYYPATRTLYFSNQLADRVEVFDVNTRTFAGSIRVGSQPVHIAFVPNASGQPTSMLLVANSGGSDISVVDVANGKERRIQLPPFYVGDAGSPDNLPLPDDSITWYPLSSRPAQIAAGCVDPSCTLTRVYVTNRPSGTTSYSGTRVLTLDASYNLVGSDLVVLTYPAGVINPDRSDARRLVVRHSIYDPSNVRSDSLGAISGTIYRQSPVIAVDAYGNSPLFIGDSQDSCIGTAQTCVASRILKVDPNTPWHLTAVASHDYLRNHGEPIREMHVNSDGSMLAVLTNSGVALLDGNLSLLGTLALSGNESIAPATISFIYGHNSGALGADNGGLIAVAHGNAPYVDLYDTYNFDLLKRFRIRDVVTGPIHLQFTSLGGDIAIFAAAKDGIVVLETSLAEILASMN